jgi:hypothetical protein
MLMDELAAMNYTTLMEVSKSPLGIRASFEEDKVCLLHGVTPVGKQKFMCDLFKKC